MFFRDKIESRYLHSPYFEEVKLFTPILIYYFLISISAILLRHFLLGFNIMGNLGYFVSAFTSLICFYLLYKRQPKLSLYLFLWIIVIAILYGIFKNVKSGSAVTFIPAFILFVLTFKTRRLAVFLVFFFTTVLIVHYALVYYFYHQQNLLVFIDSLVANIVMIVLVLTVMKRNKNISRYQKIMLKEIRHRVGNNLQIVTSMLQLKMFETSDPFLSESLKDLNRRIFTMSLLHKKLTDTIDLHYLPLLSYLKELSVFLKETYNQQKSTFSFRVHSNKISLQNFSPLSLVLSEIFGRFLEKANKLNKSIQTNFLLNQIGDELYLKIESPDLTLDEAFLKGSSFQKDFIAALLKQISAQISIKQEEEKLSIAINFPLLLEDNGTESLLKL